MELILAGHTHGGQVCVPGFGALTTNCDLPADRVKGLSEHHTEGHHAWLHVSAGIGTSPFAPYRFACPPEVTLLTLVGAQGPAAEIPSVADATHPSTRIKHDGGVAGDVVTGV